ncbi:MAG: SPOR domain-containing protein [Methylococcaceae bacterium]|nr:SPOR domain-containing protein [Methylococcaceae bacterium]
MAESNKGKDKKTLDAFADDLDAMLNMDETPAAQKVGLIEDDDAIDRLLMGDNFQHTDQEIERDEFADIDALIGDDFGGNRKVASDIDEFADDIDDMIAKIQTEPKRQSEPVVGEIDEFADVDDDMALVKSIDEVVAPEVAALETVADIDEFSDEFADVVVPAPAMPVAQKDEIEGMKEIDEFSDISPPAGSSADFLMADFDISSGEDVVKPVETKQPVDEFGDDADVMPVAPAVVDERVKAVAVKEEQVIEDEFEGPASAVAASVPEKKQPQADHGPELAALANQLTVLKKQHQVFRQEMTEKAGKDELVNCLEGLDKLETEQKKTKRTVDAVSNKKPVAAYVANGLAITALLIGTGLGFQGFIAKSQVAELVPMISKLQEQVNANPASDAADKEMLHKQLADLAAASSVTSNQIAEINKALQGDSGSAKTGGDLGKQLAELSNQNLQMGAAIEALQSKISALEKGRIAAVAPVPKPEKKKPVVVEENWAVNLIAFKQDWYAKRKAEEFAAKGVPAKVSKSEAKGETWYRLSVDGFKSQYEAAGYAAKIKKTLNLDSVWVARNKD